MADIEFGTYEAPEKVNEYAEHVKALAEKNDENAAMTVTVDVNDAQKTQFKIQRAANDIGKTAKLRLKDEANVKITGKDEDGNDIREGAVRLVFTLTRKHKARRGPNREVEATPEPVAEKSGKK